MARTRQIKPDFFADDELAECSPLARLLFIGLWMLADREGRLEDKPRPIKALILPYDDCDANVLLNELTAHHIVRYEVDGGRYIAIRSFAKHQKPYNKEPASVLPAPPSLSLARPKLAASLQQSIAQGTGNREQGTGIQGTVAAAVDAPHQSPEEAPATLARRSFAVSACTKNCTALKVMPAGTGVPAEWRQFGYLICGRLQDMMPDMDPDERRDVCETAMQAVRTSLSRRMATVKNVGGYLETVARDGDIGTLYLSDTDYDEVNDALKAVRSRLSKDSITAELQAVPR